MDYEAARTNMIQRQLRPCGISDSRILDAFASVPRQNFIPDSLAAMAYCDAPIKVGDERFLPSPITHARLLSIANPCADDVALDIGADTGYSAAVLSYVAGTVIALENDADLLAGANKKWQDLRLSTIVASRGSPADGDSNNAPFDLIVIGGAVSQIPQNLVDQLSKNGRLVTVLRKAEEPMGRGVTVRRIESGGFSVYPEFDSACPYHYSFAP